MKSTEQQRRVVLPQTRIYPSRLPIRELYFIENSIKHENSIHPTYDIKFTMGGHGFMTVNNKRYEVPEYSISIIKPGIFTREHSSGEGYKKRVALVYNPNAHDVLAEMGLLDGAPVWEIKNVERMLFHFNEIEKLTLKQFEGGNAELIDLYCEALLACAVADKKSHSKSSIIEDIAKYIDKHYTEDIKIESLNRRFGLSRANFFDLWQKKMGITPRQYILYLRMHRAEYLLEQTNLRINEIAAELGFDNPQYFARQFKFRTGRTPRDFRKFCNKKRAGLQP